MELKRYLRVVASTGDDDDDYSMVEISNRRAREAADRIEKLEAALDEAAFSQTLFDAVVGQRNKATDRIEKLEAALRSIAANACCDSCREAALVARKALEGKDD